MLSHIRIRKFQCTYIQMFHQNTIGMYCDTQCARMSLFIHIAYSTRMSIFKRERSRSIHHNHAIGYASHCCHLHSILLRQIFCICTSLSYCIKKLKLRFSIFFIKKKSSRHMCHTYIQQDNLIEKFYFIIVYNLGYIP